MTGCHDTFEPVLSTVEGLVEGPKSLPRTRYGGRGLFRAMAKAPLIPHDY